MKKVIKDAWIAALGEYKQCQRRLRNGDCFCATGVLCDLYVKAKVNNQVKWVKGEAKDGALDSLSTGFCHGNWYGSPPPEVREWAGFKTGDDTLHAIAQANDDGKTFEEIIALVTVIPES